MALYVNHDLRCVNGQTIYLPKWKGGEDSIDRDLTIPDVYVLDTVQKYPVGTKFVDSDRVFHYGYCNAIHYSGSRGMGGMLNLAEEVYSTAKAVAHIVGETEIVLADATSTLNQWAGGYYMPRVHPYSSYRILSNTATDLTNITLTLERGLLTELPSGGRGFLNQNPYSKLESRLPNSNDPFASSMGVNLVMAVADRWLWIQTWGPCYITGGDELLGKDVDVREAVFHRDGTLQSPVAYHNKQRAGYAIPKSSDALATWFVYLQLAC